MAMAVVWTPDRLRGDPSGGVNRLDMCGMFAPRRESGEVGTAEGQGD